MSELFKTSDQPDAIESPAVWYGRDLQHADNWLEQLSAEEVEELLSAVRSVNKRGISMLEMKREDFPLPTLTYRFQRLANDLNRGRGFWLLRGLPIENLTERDAAFAYWGIGLHLGTPVSQNARGHLLGHVTDEGLDFKKDSSARGYQTRLRLPYHTDSSDVVGLMCLRPAKNGGISSVASTTNAYNEVNRRRPDLKDLWFAEWYSDRRNEQLPGQDPYFLTRLASWDGEYLSIRYVRNFLDSAQRHEGAPSLTLRQTEFLDLIDTVANEPGFALQMDFRPGDIQFVCNYTTFHSRTAYEDHDDHTHKRHLLRLWLTLHEGRAIPTGFGRGQQTGTAGRGGIPPVPGKADPQAGTYI
ncbi:MAG: hypothetical protein ACJAVI_003908 [Candidatus Azotimanducaceae bacterium]|jgi:hypothetical protein